MCFINLRGDAFPGNSVKHASGIEVAGKFDELVMTYFLELKAVPGSRVAFGQLNHLQMDKPIATRRVEVTNILLSILVAVSEFGLEVHTISPVASFFVEISAVDAGRVPRGFRNAIKNNRFDQDKYLKFPGS